MWRGVGVAALIALVITARLLQDDGSIEPAIQRAKVAAKVTTPPPLSEDTALATKLATADTPTPQPPASATTATTDSVARDSVPRAVGPTDFSARVAATKPSISSATKPATTIASKARRPTTRWVSSISRDWVPVRAGASKRSRLIASIGPNSRVQLGESRDGWRRIRAKGLNGWVEQHVEFRVATSR